MEPYLIWVLVGLGLAILEIFTAGFGVIFFAVGAWASAIAAACDTNLNWQIGIFILVSVISLLAFRPLLVKWMSKRKTNTETNADALIGRQGFVKTEINNENNQGEVAIDGDIWRAKADDNEIIPVGTKVEVIRMESIVMFVKKI